jgi:hypothetical protein
VEKYSFFVSFFGLKIIYDQIRFYTIYDIPSRTSSSCGCTKSMLEGKIYVCFEFGKTFKTLHGLHIHKSSLSKAWCEQYGEIFSSPQTCGCHRNTHWIIPFKKYDLTNVEKYLHLLKLVVAIGHTVLYSENFHGYVTVQSFQGFATFKHRSCPRACSRYNQAKS